MTLFAYFLQVEDNEAEKEPKFKHVSKEELDATMRRLKRYSDDCDEWNKNPRYVYTVHGRIPIGYPQYW